ncbi:MAG: RluA family pseudouridine synthase [Chloroflexota bacterium]|nr:RluA family pseudouridine synthase [Chloroflexota bacterium]
MKSLSIPIIYQDHHLLIVNKPAHLVIHPSYKNTEGTMWDVLLEYLAEQGTDDWQPPTLPDEPAWSGAPLHIQEMLREKRTERLWKEDGLLPRPCLLHRLDKDTSGVVALARTARSRRYIIAQFHDYTIDKRYLAVVQKGAFEWSRPRTVFAVTRQNDVGAAFRVSEWENAHSNPFASLGDDELVLNGPLQRDPDDRRRCIVGADGADSQSATTVVKVLATSEAFILLEVRPITGRTHQIRAHLAALGYAIVGDAMYAQPAEPGTPSAALTRQFLHAYSLKLRRYPDGERCRFVAPLAGDLLLWTKAYFPEGLGALNAKFTLSS